MRSKLTSLIVALALALGVAGGFVGHDAIDGRASAMRTPLSSPSPDLLVPCPVAPVETALACLRVRPGVFPSLRSGDPCVISLIVPFSLVGTPVPDPPTSWLLGPGPVRVVLPQSDGIIGFNFAQPVDGWVGQKAPWVVDAGDWGPVLIRGRRLDGPGDLRFTVDTNNPSHAVGELALGMAHAVPSLVWLREPGCYAYQVEGPKFSEIILFRAG